MRVLKIGILLNTAFVPAWIEAMIIKISAIDGVQIMCVIYNNSYKDTSAKKSRGFNNLIYKFYREIDKKLYSVKDDAFKVRDISDLLKPIAIVSATPIISNGTEKFDQHSLEIIHNYQLDIILKLGFGNLGGDILASAKYGIWDLQNSNQYTDIDGMAGVYEVFAGINVTRSVLKNVGSTLEKGQILYFSKSMTQWKSVHQNINLLYWKSNNYIPRLLNLWTKNGDTWFWNFVKSKNYEAYVIPKGYLPNNATMLMWGIKQLRKLIYKNLRALFYFEQWQIWILSTSDKEFKTSNKNWIKLKPSKTLFWADPHIIKKGSQTYIFIEEYVYQKQKGHISVAEINQAGFIKLPELILEKTYHLSYPFILEHRGTYYMIPETRANKTIQLYRSTEFPYKWEFVKNLMINIHAVDSTLLYYNDRWWIFANVISNKGMSSLDELFVFYADNLFSNDWVSHKLNPVISDVTRARPAGAFFTENGKLYRPSQFSTKIYGTGVNINEVIELTTDSYHEVINRTIDFSGQDSIRGVHSFSRNEELTVVDVNVVVSKYFD